VQKIAIHSVPRSGSTWLGNIFNSHPQVSFKYQPLFSYAFKDYLNDSSNASQIDEFFKAIHASNDAFINQKEGIEKDIIPVFKKDEVITHSCYKEVRYHHILENMLQECKTLKAILLIRNPLSVLQSWYKAPKEFKNGWVFEEEWLNAPKKNLNKPEEFNGYNKWKEATSMFLKLKTEYNNQVHLMTYSDLLKNTNEEVHKAFKFCDLEFHAQTYQFLTTSKLIDHNDAYSVYKKRELDNSWKELSSHIIDFITKDLKNTDLEHFLNE
jgi:hypothetical protein